MTSGVTMTTTLLAKDTAHKTVYPVFTAGGGFDMAEMQGGGDFVMVADPATFQVLPWAPHTGWLLCDIVFTNGKPVPFSTRQILRDALGRLAEQGLDFLAGLEVEFHLFKLENPRLSPEDATWPPRAPEVSLLNQGYQYLTETRFDQIDAALEPIRRGVEALGMPLRSLEIELGPSQCEFTFRPAIWTCRRRHDDFVPRGDKADRTAPRSAGEFHVPAGFAQSVFERLASASIADRTQTRPQCFRRPQGRRAVRHSAGNFLGGLLAHARAAAAFTTPTVNGYKRYRPFTLAPDRAIWARDNRGVMVRVLGQPGDPSTHLENRVGEPAANPYLYIASQIYSGCDGIAHKRDPGPAADTPYETDAPPLPKNLGEAAAALRADQVFRQGFGNGFVDYYAHIKEAEYARFMTEAGKEADVTAWEQNEYFDLLARPPAACRRTIAWRSAGSRGARTFPGS